MTRKKSPKVSSLERLAVLQLLEVARDAGGPDVGEVLAGQRPECRGMIGRDPAAQDAGNVEQGNTTVSKASRVRSSQVPRYQGFIRIPACCRRSASRQGGTDLRKAQLAQAAAVGLLCLRYPPLSRPWLRELQTSVPMP